MIEHLLCVRHWLDAEDIVMKPDNHSPCLCGALSSWGLGGWVETLIQHKPNCKL